MSPARTPNDACASLALRAVAFGLAERCEMLLYTFHCYADRDTPVGIIFLDCDDDAAALEEAGRLLDAHESE